MLRRTSASLLILESLLLEPALTRSSRHPELSDDENGKKKKKKKTDPNKMISLHRSNDSNNKNRIDRGSSSKCHPSNQGDRLGRRNPQSSLALQAFEREEKGKRNRDWTDLVVRRSRASLYSETGPIICVRRNKALQVEIISAIPDLGYLKRENGETVEINRDSDSCS
ncbi:hypothetical protein U1Q18_021917 [Sarracenia purpurea var. burkii]